MLNTKLEEIKKKLYLEDVLQSEFVFAYAYSQSLCYEHRVEKGVYVLELRVSMPDFCSRVKAIEFVEHPELLFLRLSFYTTEQLLVDIEDSMPSYELEYLNVEALNK